MNLNWSLFVCFGLFSISQSAQVPIPTEYVGVGYNLLTGNPDGGTGAHSGVDTGLLYTRKIFQLTNPVNGVPRETVFVHHASCHQVKKERYIYNTHVYRDELLLDVQPTGNVSSLQEHAFSLSEGFKFMDTATNVHHKLFRDVTTVCNFGRLRYKEELARADQFSVTREFAASVCELPASYDHAKYMQFLDMWGTHVVLEVESGIKVLERFEITTGEFFDFAMKYDPTIFTIEGPFGGYNESIAFRTSSFATISPLKLGKGTLYEKISIGSNTAPEALGLKVSPITSAFDGKYWQVLRQLNLGDQCLKMQGSYLRNISVNIETALSEYGNFKHASNISDTEWRIPLTWPLGEYGLPESAHGCPNGKLSWREGSVTLSSEAYTSLSSNIKSYMKVSYSDRQVTKYLCMKNSDAPTAVNLNWQPGNYCIYQNARNCPNGFDEGSVTWQYDYWNNAEYSSTSGEIPWMTIDNDAHTYTIYFCCRHDGSSNEELILPTSNPFMLLRIGSGCQKVHGMKSKEVFIKTVGETGSSSGNKNAVSGVFPYDERSYAVHKLFYCYYEAVPKDTSTVVFG